MKKLIILSALMCSVSTYACPDFSGKYDLNIQVVQNGCETIRVKNLSENPNETPEIIYNLGQVSPRPGNDTWTESVNWKQDVLVFVSRYSDEYLKSGVKIGDQVDVKKVFQFKLLSNGNVEISYSVFNIHEQPVDTNDWYTITTQRIP